MNWIHHISNSQSYLLGIWFRIDGTLDHFKTYTSESSITKVAFKRKMHIVCNTMALVFKKDMYDSSDKRYVTYYLFLSNNTYTQHHVKTTYTIHSYNMNNPTTSTHTDSLPTSTNSDNNTTDRKTDLTSNNQMNNIVMSSSQFDHSQCKWTSPEALKYFIPTLFHNKKERKREN